MPNLLHLKKLKEKYGDNSGSSLNRNSITPLLEAFDPDNIRYHDDRISKAFNPESIRTKLFSISSSRISSFEEYFLNREKTSVVLLFIDITGFSKKFIYRNSHDLGYYLDNYYKQVIPVIDASGGVIEKIMGDGIICIYGEPFLSDTVADLHKRANRCCRELIKKMFNTEYALKIGLHYGEIMYYQNPTEEYFEYTMVGNALTELFRLESVSEPNSINFYGGTYFDQMIEQEVSFHDKGIRSGIKAKNLWWYTKPKEVFLQGVEYDILRTVEYRE